MKIIDESTPGSAPKPSMFLHGLTGHGKSTWATTGGRPLVILTEPKAQSVLRLINPQAVGIVPESLDDLDGLMVYLGQTAKLEAKGIDRIVLDSYTELTQALPRWIKQKMGPVGTLVKLEQSEFGSLQDYALAIVKAIQYTGYPSVIIGRSTSKKVGLAESIRPDGLGKSIEQLPGKLLPTAEARFDAELGYVIDTTPADHSQRCGLRWVPAVWSGSCLDYLQVIEAGPATSAPDLKATAPAASAKPKPAAKPEPDATPRETSAINPPALDCRWTNAIVEFNTATHRAGWTPEERTAAHKEWEAKGLAGLDALLAAIPLVKPKERAGRGPSVTELPEIPAPGAGSLARELNAPDPEKDPAGYQRAAGEMFRNLDTGNRAKPMEIPLAAAQFADEVAAGPGRAKPEDIRELTDLCIELKVDMDCLWSYAMEKGGAHLSKDGAKDWLTLSADFFGRVAPQFKDPQKRIAVISWLHKKYMKVPF